MSLPTALADVRRVARGPVRRLYVGQLLKSLGAGMTLALLAVYLHKVRGIPISVATALLAWQAALALACSPVIGTLVDRFGPRRILMGAALLSAAGTLAYGFITTVPQAFAAMTVVAVAGAGIWGPSSALMARLVPPGDRSTAFGFEFMLLNLGLGLGGLIGAAIVDLSRPATFQVLYALTALAFVALFVAVLSMGDVGRPPVATEGAPPESDAGREAPEGSWREVLRDRALLRYGLVGLLLLTFGYGSMDSGLSLYVTDAVGLNVKYVGVIFAANTAVIVVMQLFSLSIVRGRRRSRMLAMVGVIWAGSWLLFGAADLPGAAWLAALLAIVAMVVFALGETLWSPVAPALLNDLAPEHLRGRYNSFQSILWGVSGSLGPLISGAFLSNGMGRGWTLTLTVGCLLGSLLALRLGRSLTAAQEGHEARAQQAPSETDDDPDQRNLMQQPVN